MRIKFLQYINVYRLNGMQPIIQRHIDSCVGGIHCQHQQLAMLKGLSRPIKAEVKIHVHLPLGGGYHNINIIYTYGGILHLK